MPKILITRPVHQTSRLCKFIKNTNLEAVLFPTIEIVSIPVTYNLNLYDIAIFISANAVVNCKLPKNIPENLQLAAVGKATAKILNKANYPIHIFPDKQFNSEALLELPALQSALIKNKKIAIFRGDSGRELLAKTLKIRGAKVEYINVYQRLLPRIDITKFTWAKNGNNINPIVITSGEGLENLFKMLNYADWLVEKQFIIMSKRLIPKVENLGIKKTPIIVAQANDAGIFQAINSSFSHI
jgi:uroporphyrinogen-III synthase